MKGHEMLRYFEEKDNLIWCDRTFNTLLFKMAPWVTKEQLENVGLGRFQAKKAIYIGFIAR